MASNKSGKQFLNFENAMNKRKHDNYEPDGVEHRFFPPTSVDDEQRRRKMCL